MPRITASLENATYLTCDYCEPEDARPIRYIEALDSQDDVVRLCFPHAAQFRDSDDPEKRLWARKFLNLEKD
jgi:hypothetical protein